jgi:hypothetical protein
MDDIRDCSIDSRADPVITKRIGFELFSGAGEQIADWPGTGKRDRAGTATKIGNAAFLRSQSVVHRHPKTGVLGQKGPFTSTCENG